MRSQAVELPNGMTVHSKRSEEALLMYGEVGDYLKHGMHLKPGDVVVDVGANIGIFSLWAYHQCGGDLTAYAFEPIGPIFELLDANFKRTDSQHLKAFNVGLSRAAGQVTFAYYPNATFASTAYPDSAQADRELTATLLQRSLHQLPAFLGWVQMLPAFAQRAVIKVLAYYINQRQFVTCELQTLSAIIQRERIERIDFLKIDAEKSELDVLNGLAESDWDKVQQVFAEVHNRDERVDAICELLRRHGFRTIVHEQPLFFADTDIHAVYAAR